MSSVVPPALRAYSMVITFISLGLLDGGFKLIFLKRGLHPEINEWNGDHRELVPLLYVLSRQHQNDIIRYNQDTHRTRTCTRTMHNLYNVEFPNVFECNNDE